MANKNNTTATTVGIGAAAVAAAAAAAGAYWLYGAKHSAQHRRMAKSWMLKARAEVLDAVEKLQEIDKESYMSVVEGVIKNYSKKAGTTPAELSQMMRDLKGAWVHIQQAQKSGKKGAKTAKRAGKKAVRKAKKAVSKK
jgi:hypothetical protein